MRLSAKVLTDAGVPIYSRDNFKCLGWQGSLKDEFSVTVVVGATKHLQT